MKSAVEESQIPPEADTSFTSDDERGSVAPNATLDTSTTTSEDSVTPPSPSSRVDHPAHYGGDDDPYEAIKVIEAQGWGPAFCKGNALKYLLRAGRKEGESERTDLEKAKWYLDRAIGYADPEPVLPAKDMDWDA